MKSHMHESDRWLAINDYTIFVHSALRDAVINDTGLITPEFVRSVRILVEYINHSDTSIKFRLSQWLLFDTDGFSYESEIRNQFYEDDASCKLREGIIDPGQQAKGWVAFKVSIKSRLSHIQFRADFITSKVINIRLSDSSQQVSKGQATSRALQCPSCGAPLLINSSGPTVQCSYCDNTIFIPEALQNKSS